MSHAVTVDKLPRRGNPASLRAALRWAIAAGDPTAAYWLARYLARTCERRFDDIVMRPLEPQAFFRPEPRG